MREGLEDEQAVTDPDATLMRWRGRLKPKPAKARSTKTSEPLERPRTVAEAAEELGLSVHTIRAWVAERRLTHLRLGRAIRIPAAEIRRVIEASTIPADKED
jgi:excisionase family DNA binding protein